MCANIAIRPNKKMCGSGHPTDPKFLTAKLPTLSYFIASFTIFFKMSFFL